MVDMKLILCLPWQGSRRLLGIMSSCSENLQSSVTSETLRSCPVCSVSMDGHHNHLSTGYIHG